MADDFVPLYPPAIHLSPAQIAKGGCYLTGESDLSKLISTNVTIYEEGILCLSHEAIRNLAQCAGFDLSVTRKEVKDMRAQITDLQEQLLALEDLVLAFENAKERWEKAVAERRQLWQSRVMRDPVTGRFVTRRPEAS